MSPQKTVFDKPIVRTNIDRVIFPRICPVCGASADKTSRVTFVMGKDVGGLGRGAALSRNQRGKMGFGKMPMRSILVPVCEDHKISDESDWRYRFLFLFADGVMASILLFTFMFTAGSILLGRGIAPWSYGVFALAIILFGSSALAFRSRPLETALKIIGTDPTRRYIWLKLANTQYREEFMKLNSMNSELVTWVVKA